MLIYCATFPNNKIYIGCTVQTLAGRKRSHKYDAKNGKTNMIFHKAINKYGFENIKWSVLFETFDHSELLKKEQEYIQQYKSLTPNGYNITLGGEGVLGCKNNKGLKRTEEQKLMFRKVHAVKGKPIIAINNKENTYKEYVNVAEMCRQLNLPYKSVKNSVRLNKNYSHFSFKRLDGKLLGI